MFILNLENQPANHIPSMNTFTPRAQQVIALARKASDRLNHSYVGTEHILLGLIMLRQGTAELILQNLKVDLEALRKEIETRIGKGSEKFTGPIPYTPRFKKVLALASKEAGALEHRYLGTEHILFGLIRESDGVAACVLKALGLTLMRVRQEMLKMSDPAYSHDGKYETRRREEVEKIARSLITHARALCALHGLDFQTFI